MGFSKQLTVLVLLLYTTGVLGAELKSSIIGGQNARKGSSPWMVHLNISNTDRTKRWRCGGALLNNQWVVTAAHCFKNRNPEPDFIRTGVWIGAYELHKGAERYRTIVYPVYPTYHHYHDTGRGYENDIVLLKLTKKVEFTDNIAPINLPADKSPIESFSECWITGWGQVGNGVPLPAPETLQQLKVSIMSKSRCKEAYPHLTSTILCADRAGGSGACDGDYGGPLVCRGSRGNTLVGVMSYGGPSGCGGPGSPVAFAQVSEYLEFINYYINLPGEASADV